MNPAEFSLYYKTLTTNRKVKRSRCWYYANKVCNLERKCKGAFYESKGGEIIQIGWVGGEILKVRVHIRMYVETKFIVKKRE